MIKLRIMKFQIKEKDADKEFIKISLMKNL